MGASWFNGEESCCDSRVLVTSFLQAVIQLSGTNTAVHKINARIIGSFPCRELNSIVTISLQAMSHPENREYFRQSESFTRIQLRQMKVEDSQQLKSIELWDVNIWHGVNKGLNLDVPHSRPQLHWGFWEFSLAHRCRKVERP